MSRNVKYMGAADEAVIPKGHDFGGTVAEGTTKEIVFDKSNAWVVDVEEAGLTSAQIDALLEDGDRFKDVSGMQRIPHNLHQTTFNPHRGMGKTEVVDDGGDENLSTASSTVSDGATTTGGSTDGDTGGGGTTARRARAGGST